MLANYGFFILLLCCIGSLYGVFSAIGAAFLRHRRLWQSSRLALSITCGLAVIASCILWYSLFQRDFSFRYIYKNSSLDLPWLYTFTAFWCSLEGSHMLWTLLLSIFSTIGLWTYAKDNEHIMPYVSAALQLVLAWMYYLAFTHSDLFATQLPAAPNGVGMNTLLQNPYMAIHPPMLFVGYTGLAIPFAYSIAALCYGDITEGWLKSVRRWTLFSWCFLTAAIALGGRWAYVELGWAGYWAWDPVENSSLMPWLMATALLHCLLIQGKLGHLKRLSIILAIFGFFLSFFGTFITRSGIITSVHAFGEGPIGPNYLAFIAGLLFLSSLLYGFRAHAILPAETDKIWGVSKESALVVTLLLVLSFAAIVFIGTIFPIVTETFTGQRISVQAPYFNAFAPYVAFATTVAIAVGNLMHYQSATIRDGKKIMLTSLLLAVPLSAGLIIGGDVLLTVRPLALVLQVVGMYLAAWSISCLTWDLVLRLRAIKWDVKLFWKRSRAYFGAYIAHVGMVIAIVGFLGNYRGVEQQVALKKGESTELFGYKFTLEQGISVAQKANATMYEAPLQVSRNGKAIGEVRPARSKYPTSGDMLHEIGVLGSFWRDIYVVLTDFDKTTGAEVTLQININPTVRFVWFAIFLMVIGGFIALLDPYRGDKTRDALAAAGGPV
jgi:cytochrome c-type biogenesis protein CcmF